MGLERAIGKAIIDHFAPLGVSANEIIIIAQAAGGGYRRGDMLEDIRVAGQRFKNEYWVEQLKSNEVIPQGLMVERDLGVDRKYRVYGSYSYYDETTDDYYEETKSFYTNDLANKAAWEGDFVDTFDESYLSEGKDFISFNITGVEHNRDWEY